MNRRSFLRYRPSDEPGQRFVDRRHPLDLNTRKGNGGRASTLAAGGLAPYTPTAGKPWNARRAGHLLRRVGFGFNWAELQAALAATPATIVDLLLADKNLPAPPGDWTTRSPIYPADNAALAQYNTWLRQTQEWWAREMLKSGNMLREKMVLFWHNHFVSEYTVVYVTQYLFTQNQLFRKFAFGDFRELTKQVTIDNAMLVYLDGALSKVGNPNENYGRELLELFTIGVGSYANGEPHYTERDVVELARALTGWTVPPQGLTSQFVSGRFDGSAKTILGKTANFGIQGHGGEDVIDHIFNVQDIDVKKSRAAVFLCQKLYTEFVHQTPDMEIVAGMAETLVSNNWSVAAVLRQLLTSEHFFDENVMGARIKGPADFVLGSIHALNLAAPMTPTGVVFDRPETHDPVTAMWLLSQWLFYPPNVKGWPGGRTWLSSVTLPLRVRYSKMWVEPVTGALPYNFDPVTFVTSLPDSEDVHKVLDNLLTLLLPIDIGKETKESLLGELLGGGFDYEWEPTQASQKIRSCLVKMANLAEYQLM